MKYSINQFFDPSECQEIIDYAENNAIRFSYTKDRESWDCKRLPDSDFTEALIKRFRDKYNDGSLKLWFPFEDFEVKSYNISLTKYYDGRWLDLHLDQVAKLTTVIVLNDKFYDGRFILSRDWKLSNGASKAVPRLGTTPGSKIDFAEKIELAKGESITFSGMETYHGVLPVTEGIRYSLAIWQTDIDHNFIKPAKQSII